MTPPEPAPVPTKAQAELLAWMISQENRRMRDWCKKNGAKSTRVKHVLAETTSHAATAAYAFVNVTRVLDLEERS